MKVLPVFSLMATGIVGGLPGSIFFQGGRFDRTQSLSPRANGVIGRLARKMLISIE